MVAWSFAGVGLVGVSRPALVCLRLLGSLGCRLGDTVVLNFSFGCFNFTFNPFSFTFPVGFGIWAGLGGGCGIGTALGGWVVNPWLVGCGDN